MRKHSGFYYKRQRMRRGILVGIFFAAGIALLICAGILLFPPKSKPTAVTITPSTAASPTPAKTTDYSSVPNTTESAEKKDDIVGWIRIEGTVVDYPVVQTDDLTYYLTHDATKTENVKGAIYLDRNCDPVSLSGNNILYGHHMKDGSMFATLVEYKDETFFENHPVIEFDTLEKTYEWEIFSVFITDPSYEYLQTAFSSSDQYLDFITTMQGKSLFETDILLGSSDDILILSTCTYEYDDARFVVAAVKRN